MYWDNPTGGIHGSTKPADDAVRLEMEGVARQIASDGGTVNDLRAKFPNADHRIVNEEFNRAKTNADWNPMDNQPGDQGSVYGSAKDEKERDDGQGIERVLTAAKSQKTSRGPHGHHRHHDQAGEPKPGDVGKPVNAVDTAEQQTKGAVASAIDKVKGVATNLRGHAETMISSMKEKLHIGQDNAKVAYAEDMGKVNGPNVDRMLAQGQALNSSLPGRQRSQGVSAGASLG